MKGRSLVLLMLFLSSSVLAVTYHSSKFPLNGIDYRPRTNITIINASTDMLYAHVPDTPINDKINPGENDHIYSNYDSYFTVVILRDPSCNVFFAKQICPFGVIAVQGSQGNYRVTVDQDLCE